MNFENLSKEELIKLLTMGRTSGRRLAFEFWLKSLEKIAGPHHEVDKAQIHYVARALTRFSLTPTSPSVFFFPTFTSLAQVHDEFILNQESWETPEFMEIAGCQMLLLAGFYLRTARKKYDINDLRKAGQNFFAKGAIGKRKKTIQKISKNFEVWQDLLCFLEWHLKTERLVLKVERPEEPLIKIVPG
jgi:hypothetical protein